MDHTHPDLAPPPSQPLLRVAADVARRGLELGGPDTVDQVVDEAVQVLAAELGVAHVGLFELVEHLGLLQARTGVLGHALVPRPGAEALRLPTGRGSLPGYTLLAGHTVVAHDLLADRRFLALAPTLGVPARSAVTVPVGWPGRRWGVLGVYHDRSRSWTDDEVAFVDSVAASVGLALRLADTEAVAADAADLTDLATATAGLGRWSWHGDLGHVVLDDVARSMFALGAERGHVAVDELRRAVHVDDRIPLFSAVADAFRTGSMLRESFRVARPDGGPLRWVELIGETRHQRGGAARIAGVVVDLTRNTRAPAERLEAERVARHRAEQAGARLATLSEASALFFQTLEPRSVLDALADFCVPLLADLCRIDVPDDHGRLHPRVLRGGSDAQRAALDGLARYCPDDLASVLARHQPVAREAGTDPMGSQVHDELDAAAFDLAGTSTEHRALLRDLAPTSVVVTPMVARGRVTGVLTLIDTGPGPRARDRLGLVEELAGRAALALDHSRLLESRDRMLESLQAALTPRALPGPGLLTFAARYQAADPHAAVGGDFYDVIDLADHGWGAVVGDVCGRGHDAAALTGLMRNTVRAAVVNDPRPAAVLRQTNAAVVSQLDDFRFCTATYLHATALTDTDTDTDTACARPVTVQVVASSAGHPRPVVVRADGTAERLDCGGVPLGVVAAPELTEAVVLLAPGDAVVLYTDGVTEARGPGGLFGEERLLAVLAAAAGGRAEAIAAALDEAVRAHRADGDDDVAILVIQVTDSASGVADPVVTAARHQP